MKTSKSKAAAKPGKADSLIKGAKGKGGELSEKDLKKVGGGAGGAPIKLKYE